MGETLQHTRSDMIGENERDPDLALIVGAARSGTTLLRLLLDAHPEIGCPAEAGLPALMSHMARVWDTIDADLSEDLPATDPGRAASPAKLVAFGPAESRDTRPTGDDPEQRIVAPPSRLSGPARDWIRATTLAAMRRYCSRQQTRLYVDKSLDSVYYRRLVRQIFPEVRCVLAVRHVMDTIASGIEASPWGFQAFGYAPYVQSSPGNTVAALASYWLDHVTAALEWEKEHPETCLRVRYEDLVASPEESVREIQRFLGVREDLSVLRKAFARESTAGPGDYKVEHTTGVHSNSVGHGKRVPVDMLPPPMLVAINEKLTALGYATLDRAWNAAERPVGVAVETVWSRRLQDLFGHAHGPSCHSGTGPLAVVAEDHLTLRWIIDPRTSAINQGDGEAEAVLTGTAEDLVLMLTDEENLGVLLRTGRIRHITAEEGAKPRETLKEFTANVATVRSCLSTA